MLRLLILCILIAGTLASPLPAQAHATCGSSAYAYAGVQTKRAVYGASATITALAAPDVKEGHVAGWVGAAAKNGEAWIQMGLSASPGDRSNNLYLEFAQPNRDPRYILLRTAVPVGERHRFAVRELEHRPGWWRAWLDGSPVDQPVFLPGSHGHWRAQVMGESWNDNSGACNRYSYAFNSVVLAPAPGGLWRELAGVRSTWDAGYGLIWNSSSAFTASTLGGR
jgi:hypothetical protein